ncbi:MAG: HAD family hydrolase [Dehalococcoidia bacterium]|nr:HAD family hydrolase [Dehalococcoidia bacterium]
MIKAVFFDLYNTLARFHPPREEIQVQAAAAFDLAPNPEGIVRGYARADQFMTEQNARLHIQKMPPEDRLAFFSRYEQLILEGGGARVSLDVARQVWERVRQAPSALRTFDDVTPTLTDLKHRGMMLGLISNIYRDLDDLCRDLGIDGYLDFKVSSMTAGAEKPHAPIFLTALKHARVAPHEAVHVGDQYHGDVVGARGVGIHAVLLDRDWLHPEHTDVPRIRTLPEVLRFLTL